MFCRGFGGFNGYGYGPTGTLSSGWFFLTMGLRMLIFVGLIFLAFRFFKSFTGKTDETTRILDKRFATGEIGEEEYIKRKSILSQKN